MSSHYTMHCDSCKIDINCLTFGEAARLQFAHGIRSLLPHRDAVNRKIAKCKTPNKICIIQTWHNLSANGRYDHNGKPEGNNSKEVIR